MAENAELRRDLMRAQRTSLQLLDTQKESTERIRELQDSNYGLQEEVANMRAQLSFATGNIINEIQDKVDAATSAGCTIRALKQQITEQTETIEKLKIQKRKAVTELSQVKLQMKKKKTSSKSTKSEKKKKSGKPSASSDANAAVAPSLIPAPGQAPSLVPSAQALVGKELVEDVMRDRVIRDAHLTSEVEVQFQEALLKANVERNLRGFIDRGKTGCYYCFHEVCEKGPDAWVEQRWSSGGCKLGSDKCNFLVKAVSVGFHRKLQIYNPAVLYGF
ncbi:uncharacterized protein FTJAE_10780 [Fusarium tjaetaba]|uniref:Uncharacterized protein n=1 Tax=Fusarium tjaetaba TaxID=1567544 RepID=A0A8H5VGN9_9HYPO|nr:uncharacterized protein FTJAE_10780 [Fusarium tjaetaba]KAF5622801.1 hypothetical protein FTJAE_10780 [Fusarium tjaetaba]